MRIYERLEFYIALLIMVFIIMVFIQNNDIFINKKQAFTPSQVEFIPQNESIITITFDDGWRSQYENALPILEKYNFRAMAYIIPDYVDKSYNGYLTMQQLNELQDKYHWDISSHHQNNFENLSSAELENTFKKIQAWMYLNKFKARFFLAYPQGVYNEQILTMTKKYFSTARTIHNQIETIPPHDNYRINAFMVRNSTTYADFVLRVDSARDTKQWLILIFHKVEQNPKQYTEVGIDTFESYMAYINKSKIKVMTMSQLTKIT